MPSDTQSVDRNKIHVDKIHELNRRFANTLRKIQETWTIISDNIAFYFDNVTNLKFDPILSQLQTLSKDGLPDEHIVIIKGMIKDILNLIRFKYISSDVLDNYFEEGQYDEDEVNQYANTFNISRFQNDNFLKTQWFATAKIFGEIESFLNLAKEEILTCTNNCEIENSGSRIGNSIMYYISAVKIFILKIDHEINFYENYHWSRNFNLWSWLSWTTRSGYGYNSSKEKWKSIKREIVEPMLTTPSQMMRKYIDGYSKIENILKRITNRDYAVEEGINDKINFTIIKQVNGVNVQEDITVSLGYIIVDSYKSLLKAINDKFTELNIPLKITHNQETVRSWDYRLGFVFYSENKFYIKKDSSLTVLMGFEDVDYDCRYNVDKQGYYISGPTISDDTLKKLIKARKSGKLVNIYDSFRNTFVKFGAGRSIISRNT